MSDKRPLHIVMTVNVAWNIWNFRRPLVEALIADGHRVTILAPEDETVAKLVALGCDFVPLEMDRRGLNPVRDFGLMLRFGQHFRALRPDVVLSYTIKNNLFGAIAAKRMGIAFIPNVTGLGTAFLSSGLLRRVAEALYRFAFAKLPVVFFQNGDDRALFLKSGLVKAEQARQLPGSGINLDEFAVAPYPPNDGETRFLMVARLLRDKGVFEYVEAARLVRAEFPDIRFQLLGATGSENRTAIDADTVAAWQAEGIIDYLGTTDDVRPFITTAHCVVLPSYREGAPRTLIEAAAMARPLIATDVPGCRAIVDTGENGLLCEVRSGESLAQSMREFLQKTGAEQQQMGLASRAKMEREYGVDLIISAYHDAISQFRGESPFSLLR